LRIRIIVVPDDAVGENRAATEVEHPGTTTTGSIAADSNIDEGGAAILIEHPASTAGCIATNEGIGEAGVAAEVEYSTAVASRVPPDLHVEKGRAAAKVEDAPAVGASEVTVDGDVGEDWDTIKTIQHTSTESSGGIIIDGDIREGRVASNIYHTAAISGRISEDLGVGEGGVAVVVYHAAAEIGCGVVPDCHGIETRTAIVVRYPTPNRCRVPDLSLIHI
jgi:hypothetical protein